MVKKEKRTAAEISRMVQQAIDPLGEWMTISVWPKPAPQTGWLVTASGSSFPERMVHDAQRKADELSALYEIAEVSGNQSS